MAGPRSGAADGARHPPAAGPGPEPGPTSWLLQTRIGISTYSASGSAASVTTVGALPSAKRNSTSPLDLVGDVVQVARLEADLERRAS